MDNSDTMRDAIHAAIQGNRENDDGALLVGWAVVAEWIDPAGERWLSKAYASNTSEWTARGMHITAADPAYWVEAEGDESS